MTLGATRVRAWPLVALAAGVLVVIAGAGVADWQGAIHLVALPPLDLVADLGVAFSLAGSPLAFVGLALISIALRTLLLAALLGRLDRGGLAFALRFYLVAWIPAAAAAALFAAAQASLFYALYWLGLLVALGLFGVVAALPWVRPRGESVRAALGAAWRQRLRLGTLGCYLPALLLLGAAGTWLPVAIPVLVVASAGFTWAAATWLGRQELLCGPRRGVATATAAGVLALGWVVATGPDQPPRASAPPERDGSLVLMSGIDSSSGSGAVLEIDPAALGFDCGQTYYFSYAGPGDGQPRGDAQCPIEHGAPYEPDDTLRGRDELVSHLGELVDELPRPVTVVAHSQAAWIAWEVAADGDLGDDAVVVLVGPFTENPLGFDPTWRGASTEPVRLVLDVVANVPRPGGGTSAFDPESPLAVEWLARPGAVDEVFDRSLPPSVTAVTLRSAFDLPLTGGRARLDGATELCPVLVPHPNLPFSPDLARAVAVGLGDEETSACAWWRTLPGHLWHGFGPPPSG